MATPQNRLIALVQGEDPSQVASETESNKLIKLTEGLGSEPIGFNKPPEETAGITSAFAQGVKGGVLAPLTIFRGKPYEPQHVETTGEKAAYVVGNLAGFGIGFIPVAKGAGMVLRGIGLAAGETVESQAAFNFARNVLAGSVQFAGTAEKPSKVPEKALLGAGFGAAIEGISFARALRSREGMIEGAGSPVRTGSPLDRVNITPEELSKENALALRNTDSPEAVASKVEDLRNPELSLDEALAGLEKTHQTTLHIPAVVDPQVLIDGTKGKLGANAQIFTRKVFGGRASDVLIHNPIDPAARLSPSQIAEWQAKGFYENQGVVYRGKLFRVATQEAGVPADRIQISPPGNPKVKFAPPISDVTAPVLGHVFNVTPSDLEMLSQAALRSQDEIGFALQTGDRVRRGTVSTADFERVKSISDFAREHREDILKINSETPRDAVRQYAMSQGIKGLIEEENGVPLKVHIFDQTAVNFQHEVPRLGIIPDQATYPATPDGKRLLESFVPGWRNTLTGILRAQGVQEKDINRMLELYRSNFGRQTEDLMDEEFRNLIRQQEYQIPDGCL